jgi:hypothetical protein
MRLLHEYLALVNRFLSYAFGKKEWAREFTWKKMEPAMVGSHREFVIAEPHGASLPRQFMPRGRSADALL